LIAARGEPTRPGDEWSDSGQAEKGVSLDEEQLRKMLSALRTEHRDLDVAIAALSEVAREGGATDQLQIARLKKRKLALRDRIAVVEDQLLPDIIA
jgi:hypothetical protein